MQKYAPLLPTGLISKDRQTINDNFDTLTSNFSGTYFPTSNLFEGMRAWRTDQKKMYQLSADLTTWVLVDDLSAGYNRVERANKADVAEKDSAGNVIANTYSKKSETSSIVLQCYPVGSIYMSVNATSPATLFGGTWQQISGGRVLMGQDASHQAGTTGGSDSQNITLTQSNMPSHTHTPSVTTTVSTVGGHTHTRGSMNITGSGALCPGSAANVETLKGAFYKDGDIRGAISEGGNTDSNVVFDASRTWTGETSSSGGHTHTVNTSVSIANSGSGSAFNVSHLQPYLVVYIWKRTA